MTKQYIKSAERSAADLAGVFEFDGETGYFYLARVLGNDVEKILNNIHIFSENLDIQAHDIEVKWDKTETKVGLAIRGILWAAFNVTDKSSFGGNYSERGIPQIPVEEVF